MSKLKNVLFTWVIVYVLITLLIYVLNVWLKNVPIYFRTLVLSGLMVFGLQYVIFPTIAKLKKSFNQSPNKQ
ncbi:MAG TPA: hypothetical protein DCS93_05000 [Microscillaceae bacterium]|nr:hypothetical protein [Microscillaceae bacterium]